MGYTTGRTLVREGHAGVVLAQSDEFFDPEQRYPMKDLKSWFDEFFNVNNHHFGRVDYGDEHNLYMPPTPSLGIDQVHRSKSVAHNVPVYRNLQKSPQAISTRRPSVLSVYDRYYDDKLVVTYQGEPIAVETRYGQYKGREAVQTAVHEVLADLGYGTPKEFAANALPLDEFRKAHDIEWPPAPHPLEQYFDRSTDFVG